MQLETIDFVLRTAIEEVADLLAARAQSKGVEVRVSSTPLFL